MSFLLRVVLPDRPGMLGALATALGEAGGDILSLDVVERGPDGAVDDLVVALPAGGLADRLITSAQSVDGVVVESPGPRWSSWARRGARALHTSAGAPDLTGVALPWLPLPSARRLDVREQWVPERWGVVGTELAAAPVGSPQRAVLLGRPGGPRFRASEVLRLAHLAGIADTVTGRRAADPATAPAG